MLQLVNRITRKAWIGPVKPEAIWPRALMPIVLDFSTPFSSKKLLLTHPLNPQGTLFYMFRALRKAIPAPSRQRVADLMIQALDAAGYEDLEFDADNFQIRSGSMVHNLHNLYTEACEMWPWQRQAFLRQHALGFAAVSQAGAPTTWGEVESRIYPVVRDRYYIEAVKMQSTSGGRTLEVPYRHLTDRLCITLVIDHPTLVQLVTSSHIADWGVSFEDALKSAETNLSRSTEGRLARVSEGLYVSAWSDDYDVARLLLDDTFRGLELKGKPVVMAPNKNVLIVTGEEDLNGLQKAFALAERQLDAPHPVSAAPLVRQWPNLVPLELEASHPLYAAWRRLQVLDYLPIYAEQADQLQTMLGDEVFVATYTATQDEGSGLVSSYCVWSNSVPSLLPQTERVVLFDPLKGKGDQVVGFFSWETLMQHCGHLLQATEQYPPRYRTVDFPDESTLSKLLEEQSAGEAGSPASLPI